MSSTTENQPDEKEKDWQNPLNPEEPGDNRDKEQLARQYEEAKRRKDNLSEKDHIDKQPKKD